MDLRHGLAVRARGGRRDDVRADRDAVAAKRIPRGRCDCAGARTTSSDSASADSTLPTSTRLKAARRTMRSYERSHRSASPLWLDAGIASSDDARRALDCGATRVIVGLETLPSFEVLESIVQGSRARPRRVQSRPAGRTADHDHVRDSRSRPPDDLVARAVDAGVSAVIVLDLARVGTRLGTRPSTHRPPQSRRTLVPLYAGGGVRGIRISSVAQAPDAMAPSSHRRCWMDSLSLNSTCTYT